MLATDPGPIESRLIEYELQVSNWGSDALNQFVEFF